MKIFLCLYIACPNENKTQRMCDEAVDDCLGALKFVPDWFVRSKIFEKHDFNKVTFIACKIHILAGNLNKIIINNDKKFYDHDPHSIIHVRLLAWHGNFKKRETLKKKISEELMPILRHSKRWWNF